VASSAGFSGSDEETHVIPDQTTLVYAFSYSLVTMGLFVTLSSGQFSAAHGALMGLGGYAAAVSTVSYHLPFGVALVIGALFAGLVGIVFAVLLTRTTGLLLGTVSIALGQAISLAVQNVGSLGGSQGYTGVPIKTTLGLAITLACVAVIGLALLQRTALGQSFLAVNRDETVARSLGISVRTVRLVGFGLGGLLAGLGGGLITHAAGLIQPAQLSFASEAQFFIFLVIGGFASPWGAFIGTLLVYYVQEVLLRFGNSGDLVLFGHAILSYQDRFWVLGLIMTVLVLTRPSGLIPRQRSRLAARAFLPGLPWRDRRDRVWSRQRAPIRANAGILDAGEGDR
jgi:branched-chain amino acid transport system permease protein